MKIAFDAKRLFFNDTGLGNYSRSLVRKISDLDGGNDILLFTPKVDGTIFNYFLSDKFDIHTANGKKLWRFKRMVKDLKVLRPDIYHGLSNELPIGIEKLENTKSIVTIHDLIFLKFPSYYPFIDRILYKEKFKRACEKADHIIAVSESTKQDIIELFNISKHKISVVYQSCASTFYEEGTAAFKEIEKPYFIFVSSITERKNLKLILEALTKFSKKDRPKLVVVGNGGAHKIKMLKFIEKWNLTDDVEFKGFIDDLHLKSLYSQAICTIYPSFYEGFGIPIVESLLCGTPVITSNTSSMPEAASGYGHLIDPSKVEELYEAMIQCISFPRRISSEDISKIKMKFNQETLAKQILAIYKKVIKC